MRGRREQPLGGSGRVGIGTPGSISRATGLLRGSNSVCMNGQPVKLDLERVLGREVRITNDANCFALSEASDGAGRGSDVVFGVILGTGVGAGIVVHGRCARRAERHRRRVGPQSAALAARRRASRRPHASAGNAGCIETFLSVPVSSAIICAVNSESLTTHDIVSACH